MIYTTNKRPENIENYKETVDGKFEIEYLAEFDREHREDLENALVHIGVPHTTDEREEDENGDWNEVEGSYTAAWEMVNKGLSAIERLKDNGAFLKYDWIVVDAHVYEFADRTLWCKAVYIDDKWLFFDHYTVPHKEGWMEFDKYGYHAHMDISQEAKDAVLDKLCNCL